jgi:ATP-binding cassette subfamily B protein
MRDLMQKTRKASIMVSIMVNSTMILFAIGNAAGLSMGAYLYLGGRTTIGTAVLIGWYAGMLTWPIQRIAWQMQELQRAGAGIARIRELLDVRTRIVDRCRGECALPELGALALTFDHVTFGYQDAETAVPEGKNKEETEKKRRPTAEDSVIAGQEQTETSDPARAAATSEKGKELVLHDISFHLEPGTILGLLGRTGSGKTTLTRLVFRLYDPDEGAIRLSQGTAMVDVRDLSLADLREHVGMVTQNIQLFNASVRDNLTFFDRSIPDDRILRVIHDLELGEWFAALPKGLDTELESGGGGLSAGEQQLLAFTRIFLQDPGLVILDEASSRLDPATEHLIERAVDRLVQNRTAIVIAHRLGTVQRADQIMILERGQIVEYGLRTDLAQDVHSRFYHLLQTGLEQVLA